MVTEFREPTRRDRIGGLFELPSASLAHILTFPREVLVLEPSRLDADCCVHWRQTMRSAIEPNEMWRRSNPIVRQGDSFANLHRSAEREHEDLPLLRRNHSGSSGSL